MSELSGIFVTFIPPIFILWLANLADEQRAAGGTNSGWKIFTYLLMLGWYSAALGFGLLFQAGIAFIQNNPDASTDMRLLTESLPNLDAMTDSLWLVSLGIWLPALLGLLLLLPPVRRLVARVLPIDAGSTVHAVALAFSMLVITNMLVTLGIGLDNLATLLVAEGEGTGEVTLISLWAQQLLMAFMAMVGVGWLTRRQWPEILSRLGLEPLEGQQMGLGIGLGLLMVPMVMLLEYVSSSIGFGTDPDVEALTEQLLGPLFNSPFGIITLGVAAALGEETLFRGAMQPRFGLLLTSLLFALVHSNYGVSISTVIVFALGLVLGLVRLRQNTTTSMLVHATYNMTLGVIAYMSLNMLDV